MFKVGDNIVYPMHGVGKIEAIEKKVILGKTKRILYYYYPEQRHEGDDSG